MPPLANAEPQVLEGDSRPLGVTRSIGAEVPPLGVPLMEGADVLPSGSIMPVTQGRGAAVQSGHTAPHGSQSTRGGATAVGCDLWM
jgi:hypothetical protein